MSTLVKQSQTTVKQNNLRLILSTIIRHQPLSRADLVRRTHISKPTVSSLIEELSARGLIREVGDESREESANESPPKTNGKRGARSGRKPILLRFESDRRRLLAFEMGRVAFRIAVADLEGRILSLNDGQFPPAGGNPSSDAARRLEMMAASIVSVLEQTGTERPRLLKAVCIAPGVYVEPGKGLRWLASGGAATPRGSGCPDPAAYFRNLLGCEVLLHHSTKAALLGEAVAGKARDCSNALYVDFAYGLGCAIMIDGRIYAGPGESAGEIGYFYSSPQEHQRLSVRPFELGALEQHISGKALADRAAAVFGCLPAGSPVGRCKSLRPRSAADVFEAFRRGDPQAREILQEAFSYFNMALCNVINLLAPELVIFGGGFSEAGEILLELIRPGVRDKVLMPPRLEVSELKNRASLIGGIRYLIEHTDFLTELSEEAALAAPDRQGGVRT